MTLAPHGRYPRQSQACLVPGAASLPAPETAQGDGASFFVPASHVQGLCRIQGDFNSVHAFPSTVQNSPSIIRFPDCWISPRLAGGWYRKLRSWLKPSLQALRCQRGFTSASLVLCGGLLLEEVALSIHEACLPACLPVDSNKGLTVTHKPNSVFGAAVFQVIWDRTYRAVVRPSRTSVPQQAVMLRFVAVEKISQQLCPLCWSSAAPAQQGQPLQPLLSCHRMGRAQLSAA